MTDLNKVTLLGTLSIDPISRKMPSGSAYARFTLVTGYTWKDAKKIGRVEDGHTIVAFGKLAEIAAQYLKKGDRVYVEGRLKTWKGRESGQARNVRNEVLLTNLIMLGKASKP